MISQVKPCQKIDGFAGAVSYPKFHLIYIVHNNIEIGLKRCPADIFKQYAGIYHNFFKLGGEKAAAEITVIRIFKIDISFR